MLPVVDPVRGAGHPESLRQRRVDRVWQAGREVVFSSRTPVPVEARWILTPYGSGTNLQAAFSLDLVPLMGMLAALVPQQEVANMIAPDLDAALAEVARRVECKQ